MIKTTFAIVALLAIGVTFAYAEESTVQVPFDYHGMSCWLESELIYQCIWEGELIPFTVEDLEQFKDMISPEVYAEKLAELQPTETVVIVIPEKDPTEKKIELLADKLYSGTADVEDSVLYHLLTQLDTCQQGMDSRTAPFQNAREFTISEYTQWNVNHIEYKQEIGKLVKAIEECEAQQVLAYQVVGAGYMNMPTGEDDVQYSLLTELEGIQALDFELYTKNSNRIDMNGICDNNQYDWKNRIMMGCEDTRVYDGTTHKGTSGKIQYFSQIMGEYNEYLQNNNKYATVEDKQEQAELAAPLVQEMLEENSWYGRD